MNNILRYFGLLSVLMMMMLIVVATARSFVREFGRQKQAK